MKAATGEVITAEELGGADIHCRQSGVADYLALNDEHALYLARRVVSHLNRPKRNELNRKKICEPLYDAHELNGIIPKDPRKPFDIREIIARVVDGSEFDEFKSLYGNTLVCGFSHLYGYPVELLQIMAFYLPKAL